MFTLLLAMGDLALALGVPAAGPAKAADDAVAQLLERYIHEATNPPPGRDRMQFLGFWEPRFRQVRTHGARRPDLRPLREQRAQAAQQTRVVRAASQAAGDPEDAHR